MPFNQVVVGSIPTCLRKIKPLEMQYFIAFQGVHFFSENFGKVKKY